MKLFLLLISRSLIAVSLSLLPWLKGAQAQPLTLIGNWKIDFVLSDSGIASGKHAIQFNALEPGTGHFLLLDNRSSLFRSPRIPRAAVWQQKSSDEVRFSGEIIFPGLADYGARGVLKFKGRFDSTDTVSGEVSFVPTDPDRSETVSFSAKRVVLPTVRLISPGGGERFNRGSDLSIDWQAEHSLPLASQDLWLYYDDTETYSRIALDLESDLRSFAWTLPEYFRKSKKAFIVVEVIDEHGNVSQSINERAFRIK